MSSFALAATIALRPLDADPGWRPVFSAREDLTTFLGDAPADQQQRVREAADAYRAAMEANAITDAAVAADPTRHRRVHVAGLAAAVVFAPLESSMSDTERPYCGIRCLRASASTASPAATSEPPMKMAVRFRSFGPRVKMQPWTKGITFCGVTPP